MLVRENGPREGNVSCRKEGPGCPRKMAGSVGPALGKPWAGRSRGTGGGGVCAVPQEIGWSTAKDGNLQTTRVRILLMEMLTSECILNLPSGMCL